MHSFLCTDSESQRSLLPRENLTSRLAFSPPPPVKIDPRLVSLLILMSRGRESAGGFRASPVRPTKGKNTPSVGQMVTPLKLCNTSAPQRSIFSAVKRSLPFLLALSSPGGPLAFSLWNTGSHGFKIEHDQVAKATTQEVRCSS